MFVRVERRRRAALGALNDGRDLCFERGKGGVAVGDCGLALIIEHPPSRANSVRACYH